MDSAPSYTVNDILDRFQAEYVPNELSPRTQVDYGRHVRDLRKWFGARIADEMRPRDFAEFMNVRKGRIQRNKQLAVLSCAFGQAVGVWYMCDRNPCRDVKRHRSRPRDRYIKETEFRAFQATCPARMQIAMELSLLTGQRQGDVLAMKWNQVDRTSNCIQLQQGKTGKRLEIEISPTLSAVLDRCTEMAPAGEYVIRRRDGERYTSDGFRAIWQRYQRRWAKLGNERFSYHDIRAKSASECKTVEEAMLLLGHANISITRRIYDRGIRRVQPLR
jgi:integrase